MKAFRGKKTTIGKQVKDGREFLRQHFQLEETPRERRNRLQRERYANDPEYRQRMNKASKLSNQRKRAARKAAGLTGSTGEEITLVTGSIYAMYSVPRHIPGSAPKWGYTARDIRLRKSEMQKETPFPVDVRYLSHAIPGVNILEGIIHEKLVKHRVTGEFYSTSESQTKKMITWINKIESVDALGNITYKK